VGSWLFLGTGRNPITVGGNSDTVETFQQRRVQEVVTNPMGLFFLGTLWRPSGVEPNQYIFGLAGVRKSLVRFRSLGNGNLYTFHGIREVLTERVFVFLLNVFSTPFFPICLRCGSTQTYMMKNGID
jgi:hypothetical protein